MKLIKKYKAWKQKRYDKWCKEMMEYELEHMIPIKIGDIITSNGGIISKNGTNYNGKGYENGREI